MMIKKYLKILLLILSIPLLKACDAQTLQMMNDLNNALYNTGSNSTSYSNSNSPTSGTGFYTGEAISGFNKICYYNRVGSTVTLNIPSTSLCPLTY